ncbi:MAG: DegV family protein [Thermotogota bacterium]|nr:DegV family protein [Thermotogota bacterium]
MIGVIVDSGTDILEDAAKKDYVEIVPLRVITDNGEYRDNIDISTEDLLEYMENKIPKTSLPTNEDITNAYSRLYEKGCREIICINISSGLSGTSNFMQVVAESFKKEHNDVRIEFVDTKSISIGSGLIVKKIVDDIDSGKSFDIVLSSARICVNNKVKVFFTIPTLKYLKAGGRIGKVSGTIGDFLNIKPVITVGSDGIYHTVEKKRGMKRTVSIMFEKMMEFLADKKAQYVAVYSSDKSESTLEHAKSLIEKFKEKGFKDIFTGTISQSLVVHTGKGLVGIAALVR